MSPSSPDFSHLDRTGAARMVDVGHKPVQRRVARAEGTVRMRTTTITALRDTALPKGEVLSVPKIAEIQPAKRTDELIPLCHSLPVDSVDVEFVLEPDGIHIKSSVSTSATTGVEMEAMHH